MIAAIFLGALATASPPPAACADSQVRILGAAPVIYPESAKDIGLGEVFADVEVTIDPSGHVIAAKVVKSSNNMSIDQAVVRAARKSHYLSAVRDCQPVSGAVIFHGDAVPPSL